jgi:hypothetical protein
MNALQILCLILAALAMVPALAHVLELPGKLRLTKEAYFAVQPIYYPGFTFAGISEPAGIIATIVLLALTPRGNADFWLTLVALMGFIGTQLVYWFFTHPVNNFWLRDEKLSGLGSGFFSLGAPGERERPGETGSTDWKALRDRWEYSHVIRAIFVAVSFVALVLAVS